MVYYAVANGRMTGVFRTWNECKENTHGFSGAKFKKFKTLVEANKYISNIQNALENTSPVKTGGGVQKEKDKKRGKGALGKCATSKEYLSSKTNDAPKECQYYRIFSKPMGVEKLCSGNETEVINIKREPVDFGGDFIPFEEFDTEFNPTIVKKEKIKEEQESFDAETSAFFDDKVGDDVLMLALSALQEYPEATQKKSTRPPPTQPPPAPKAKAPVYKPIKIGRYNYTMDNDGYVNVYITGHYENVGMWNCSAGYGVYFGPKHPLNMMEASTGKISHFVADLEAAINAIRTAIDAKIGKLCLHTKSEFLLKAVTSWMFAWKQKGWRNQNGKVVSNRKEFLKLDALLNDDKIYVKWHNAKDDKDAASLRAMCEAEELARDGCEEYLELHPNKDRDGDFDISDLLDCFY